MKGSTSARLSTGLPGEFVYIEDIIPDISLDLRYCSGNNFIGAPVDGYLDARAILTRSAALALNRVQQSLKPAGLGLRILDAYRPQQAVDHFVRWAQDPADLRMKSAFYPDITKPELFTEGYIVTRSSHTRGSTVDLTIVSLAAESCGEELDMGSCFDFFDPVSWPSYRGLDSRQHSNRQRLRDTMLQHGFEPMDREWWHFTLSDEPYPDDYFNFPVR